MLLLHFHHPYVAFASPLKHVGNFNFEFRDCEALAAELHGYTILTAEFLNSPVTEDAIRLLGESERRALKYWQPPTLGLVAFNFWD